MLERNRIFCGDCRDLLAQIEPGSVALSFFSPPYHLNKDYEIDVSVAEWEHLLQEVIRLHAFILKPGGFMVINMADLLAFEDPAMPVFQADNPALKKVSITKEEIEKVLEAHPDYSRYDLAAELHCSEQTINRRLAGNNCRGGRYAVGTRVKLMGGILEEAAYNSGLYLYDKRVWIKDPSWSTSNWTMGTLRAVSESEDLYIFQKPGPYTVNRDRLTEEEWKEWGLRQLWEIPSVRNNDLHPAMFPQDLASRVIRLYTDPGDLVLDPFIGSGTTAMAAVECKREYLGVEVNPQYAALAERRVKDAIKVQKRGSMIEVSSEIKPEVKLWQGDCLRAMEQLADSSIDCIICDLPYGSTNCTWDFQLNLKLLWFEYERIIKDHGAIILFAQPPFDKILACSKLSLFRYEWIYEKTSATGFLNVNKMPLKAHENILVFYKKLPVFNPQKTYGHKPINRYNKKMEVQNKCKIYKTTKQNIMGGGRTSRFPWDVITFSSDKQFSNLHPTQKPLSLLEYLILTYTNPGMVVLDNCMGSGTTGVACVNTGRSFFGMELDPEYYKVAKERIKSTIYLH